MYTEVIPAEYPRCIPLVVETLREGLPVALPSETVYGLAADALNPDAVARIFEAKGRPFFDPLIIHLPSNEWLEKIVRIPAESRGLIESLIAEFWPGPLTLVLPRRGCVPDIVCAGLPTVAVRQTAHPVFQGILKEFNGPLAAPSANRFGRISPTCAEHVKEELDGLIPLIVDGGNTAHGVESTILRIQDGYMEVLRHGPVALEELEKFGPVRTLSVNDNPVPIAPGRLESHYAPVTPLRLLAPGETPAPLPGKRCGLLAWSPVNTDFDVVENLGDAGDLLGGATRLFAAMRRLDAAGLDVIIAVPAQDQGLGRAINDRLERAAASPKKS